MLNPFFDPEVKYLYLRDPWNKQRVLTVGRKLIGEQMYFTWALNKVERAKVAHECHGYVPQDIVYDSFCRKTARHIVCKRMALEGRRHRVAVAAGDKFIDAILKTIVNAPYTIAVSGEPLIPRGISDLVARVLDPVKYPKPFTRPKVQRFRENQISLPARMVGDKFTVSPTGFK